jgi:hypothetical protein
VPGLEIRGSVAATAKSSALVDVPLQHQGQNNAEKKRYQPPAADVARRRRSIDRRRHWGKLDEIG